MARTLLFNYGQGLSDWTPFSIYRDACKLTGVSPIFETIPSFKEIPYSWSFFSKKEPHKHDVPRCGHMMLYHWREKIEFLSQPSAVKINWFRNFYWTQELLFNFSTEDISLVFFLLREKPRVLETRLPFELEEKA